MATPSKSTPILSSDSLEQKGKNMTESNANMLQCPLNQQLHSFSDGPVAILWDIENCPVPSDVRPEDVAGNIRMALRVHPVIKGAVMMFSAYGDFNAFPRRLREGCQRTGVKLIDVPNGRKDAADKAILVDMFLFALDNLPPSSIMLISGDVDFAPALHILGQRGYTVILVIPGGVGVSSALCNAGEFVWDWPSMARGEGFVPPSKALVPPRGGPIELTGYLMGSHINDNSDGQNEEESIVHRGMSQSYYNSRDFSVMSQSLSEYNCGTSNMSCLPTTGRSHSLPSGLNDVSGGALTLGAMDGGRGRGRASLPRGRGGSSSIGMRWSPRPHSHSQIPSPSPSPTPSPTPSPSPVVVDEVSDSGSSNSWPIKDGRKTSHQNSALASGSHNNKKHNSPDALGTCSPPLSFDCEVLLSHVLNKLTISESSRPPHSHDHNSQSNSKSSAEEEQEPPLVVVDPPFDICPPKPTATATVVLKPPLLLKNRERRNEIKRKNNQGTVLRPGMVLLKAYLSLTDQVKIVKRCRELGLGCGGFYQPGYREGTKLHLKMMCLGKNWDPQTSQYGDHRPSDGAVPPDIPVDFHHLIDKAIQDSHALIQQLSQTTKPHNILPSMSSNICIVNFYSQNGRLGLHQDKDESEESRSQGLPVVSFSIGDSADFLYGDERDVDKAQKVVLESGDVLIFGGRSRNVFHGVTAIHPMTAPKLLLEETNLRPGRLNLTFRQY